MKVSKKAILVPKYDSTGARNGLLLSATLNAAFFTARVNDTDTSKRWFPLPNFVDVDDNRAEPITQTFSDDRKAFIRDGVRSFSANIWGVYATPILKGKIDSARCLEMGVWLVDLDGNLTGGSLSSDGLTLYPYDISSETISAQFIHPKDKQIQGINFSFEFDPSQDDACIRMIKSTELGGADLLSLAGLRDVYATFTTPTIAGVVVDLWIDSMNPLHPVPLRGLLVTDLVSSATAVASKIRKTSPASAADVTVTTVTEDPTVPGRYTIAYTATVGFVFQFYAVKSGFDFARLIGQTFTTA